MLTTTYNNQKTKSSLASVPVTTSTAIIIVKIMAMIMKQ